jgi:hypothetical protein
MANTAFDIKSDSPINHDLKFWSIVGDKGLFGHGVLCGRLLHEC